MIINNNNNNGPGMNFPNTFGGRPAAPAEKSAAPVEKSEISNLFSQPLKHDRLTMVKLAKYTGWCGLHFFHFHKPVLGIFHLALSLIGIIGMMSFVLLLFFGAGEHLITHLLYVSASVLLLLISAAGGVLYSLYWSIHSDEDFEAAFPDCDKKN